MKQRVIKALTGMAFGFLCLTMVSCAAVRGYLKDGKDGPGIYSFVRHLHDTVANGSQAFQFPVAKNRANWIDTLHFYTQEKYCQNITLADALDSKSKTQGVLIIQNDSIVYEKYWGDISSDRLATVFSVSKSITSLMCGIAVDNGYIHSIDDAVTDYLPELKKKWTAHVWLRVLAPKWYVVKKIT